MIMEVVALGGLCRNDSGRRPVAVPRRRWPAGWAGHGWSGGQGGEGLVGEVAGGDGFDQVVDGAGEFPFGGGFGFAAYRELAVSHVVFEVAVGGFGDVAALPVGGDAFGSGQPGGHGGGGLAAGGGPVAVPPVAACSRSRCLPVAIRRSGPSRVRLCSEQ